MKIEANKLQTYLQKSTLNGSIFCGTFHIKENKLWANIKNGDALASKSYIKCQCKTEEQYNIKDINFLIKALNTFEGIIDIETKDNKMLIFNKSGEALITLSDKDYVDGKNLYDEEKPLEKMPFDYKIKIDSNILKKVSENNKTIKEGKGNINLSVKDNILKLSVGEDGFDKLIVKQEIKIDKEISSNFTLLLDVISILEGEIELHIHDNNYPIKIIMKKDEANYSYWIAPIIDN